MPTQASRTKPAATPDYSGRLARFAEAAKSADAAHVLVTNPVDVGYLTGFLGGDSYLLTGGRRPLIISDFRYQEELEPLRKSFDVHIRKGGMIGALAGVIADQRIRSLGVQAEHMTLATRSALIAQTKKATGLKLVETLGLASRLRAVKDEAEVGHLRRAIKLQQEALMATLPQIDRALSRIKGKGSLTEAQICAMLELEMKNRGSAKPSFETIIAARNKGSLPHYRPGAVKLTRNQPLLVDWGATWMGYHGDMTRTFCWGKWPAKIARIYEVVREAHELAAKALGPKKLTFEIDKIARDHIAKAGFGEYFGHGLGHGIGLDIHEEPRLSHMAEATLLVPGHVVTIEPGIYLPGVGGVRLENDYLVTPKGCENLSSLPLSLEWATR